jgi:hypothetical protein
MRRVFPRDSGCLDCGDNEKSYDDPVHRTDKARPGFRRDERRRTAPMDQPSLARSISAPTALNFSSSRS